MPAQDSAPQRRVTISDVAAAAGVSRATVSRVMNQLSTVDPVLAERVREAARQLDYSPSTLARGLAIGRTHTVALVVPDLGNPAFQAVLRGLSRAAAHEGYRVLVAETAEQVAEEAILAGEARRRCDGLVLTSPRMPLGDLAALLPRLAPVVLLNREVPGAAAPALGIDHAAGVRALLEHLAGLGHRRVAYLAGPPAAASNQARLAGLRSPLPGAAGAQVVEIACGATYTDGRAAREAVLAAGVTAVVAFNDLVALGLLGALQETGVRVPADVSVVGFDDIPFSAHTSPPLTTAAVEHTELGAQAWVRLSALLAGGEVPDDLVLEPRLQV
ncbi:LacI family DNA-binding transcriptional regulator, partial [Kineococcus glutinatus]|uniref:LacI family DNA-binding transcriptional regulator n=1 Tax=Kineococcus glutinatus TaxID=1070872 RepID=UPI0031E57BB5